MDPDSPLKIDENVPLAPLTTLQVGGPARFFVETTSERDIKRALEFAASESLPVIVLGGGSNILVSDAGFDGLVMACKYLTNRTRTLSNEGVLRESGRR